MYALHNGIYTHIAKAVRGNDYHCLDCGEKLILKQGQIKEWHYAHYSDSSCPSQGSIETAIHKKAKEVIAQSMGLKVEQAYPCGVFRADAGCLEQNTFCEVIVTHYDSQDKIDYIINTSIEDTTFRVYDFDLSTYRDQLEGAINSLEFDSIVMSTKFNRSEDIRVRKAARDLYLKQQQESKEKALQAAAQLEKSRLIVQNVASEKVIDAKSTNQAPEVYIKQGSEDTNSEQFRHECEVRCYINVSRDYGIQKVEHMLFNTPAKSRAQKIIVDVENQLSLGNKGRSGEWIQNAQ